MNVSSLGNLAVFANAGGGGNEGIFASAAKRYVEGGWGMWPITACLVIAVAIIIERSAVLFFSASINKDGFIKGLKRYIFEGNLDQAINYVAGQKPTPLTNVIKAGLMNVPKGEDEVQAALDEATLRETPTLDARTGYLAMLGNAAMLSGLLGTVSGLISCFEAVANVNPADKATILANGISEAMNCTAFGLIRHPGAGGLLRADGPHPAPHQRHQRDVGVRAEPHRGQQGQVQGRIPALEPVATQRGITGPGRGGMRSCPGRTQ